MRRSVRSPDPGVAKVAALIGEPARAVMLCAMLGGRELSASELALRAGVAPNAASAHLSKLVSGGLLRVRASGRQRFFRLADAAVGRAIESLSVIAPPAKIVALTQSRIASDLRAARSCYDHLAGRLGVAVTEAFVRNGIIIESRERSYGVRDAAFFTALEIDLDRARSARRHFARQCMDWSERRWHLAGSLGAAVSDFFHEKKLVEPARSSRALRITPAGHAWLRKTLGIDLSEAAP